MGAVDVTTEADIHYYGANNGVRHSSPASTAVTASPTPLVHCQWTDKEYPLHSPQLRFSGIFMCARVRIFLDGECYSSDIIIYTNF